MMAAVLLLGAGFVARGALDGQSTGGAAAGGADPTPVELPAGPTPTVANDGAEPVADVAAAVAPAVVHIRTNGGLGSGFIYDSSGLILTNAHVVRSERTVEVRMADESIHRGEVLGADPATDVAVVRIDADGDLPVARIAAEGPRVGQMAVALGSPFGLEQTVTAGIVSAVDRPVPNNAGVAVHMIQTDAPINPGNSGGALANRSGEVIGVNTSIFSQTGENSGIGFAIPIEVAKRVADQIAGGEQVRRAHMGVQGASQVSTSGGVTIAAVTPGGAADLAGMQEGDVIVAIDGDRMDSMAELSGKIGSYQPGDRIVVEVERDGQALEIEVTLGSTG